MGAFLLKSINQKLLTIFECLLTLTGDANPRVNFIEQIPIVNPDRYPRKSKPSAIFVYGKTKKMDKPSARCFGLRI